FVLKDGEEVCMILEEADFKFLNLKDLAASLNIFIKKKDLKSASSRIM
ncbi:hypothetical protein Tco_1133178, partial [Tanacetum coccineum]